MTDVQRSVRVLYVGGLGRSGSTLLERMLGELPGVCALGEVVHLWERGLAANESCECGEPFLSCPFWSKVGQVAFGGWDRLDAAQTLELKGRVDRNRYIPRLLRTARSTDLAAYLDLYERVYEAARDVSGADVLVDASKHASLAFVLGHSDRVDLRVLQLVRDSPAVAYSWGRRVVRPEAAGTTELMPRYSPVRAGLLWTSYNAMFDLLRTTRTPVRLVRYEDVMAGPVAALEAVAAYAGLPLLPGATGFVTAGQVSLTPGHTVAGNPMRFGSGTIALHRDERWRAGLSPGMRLLVRVTTLPMRLRLGYLGHAGRATAPTAVTQPTTAPAHPLRGPLPSVTVVVPTRDRPDLLRVTLAAIAGQDYAGRIDTLVVYDQSAPDVSLEVQDDRRGVHVVRNVRTAGLAGGRNTGILAATGDLVAFCDDDDRWHPGKITAQVAAMAARPGAVLATTGIRVRYADHEVDRPLEVTSVSFSDLLRSRLAELHPSTFLLDREALLTHIGLVSEQIPGSYGEDYEFLLRAARVSPVVHVPEVAVDVLWHQRSYFDSRWATVASGLTWLLEQYPEFADEPRGKARVSGQIAFAHAALGDRREALRWAVRTLRLWPAEPRGLLALAVIVHAVTPQRLIAGLHRRGRGI